MSRHISAAIKLSSALFLGFMFLFVARQAQAQATCFEIQEYECTEVPVACTANAKGGGFFAETCISESGICPLGDPLAICANQQNPISRTCVPVALSFCGIFPPTVTITANGTAGSITIPYNAAAIIAWSSTDADSCAVPPFAGTATSSPGVSTGNLTATQTYTASCTGPGSPPDATAIVTVNVTACKTDGALLGTCNSNGGGSSGTGCSLSCIYLSESECCSAIAYNSGALLDACGAGADRVTMTCGNAPPTVTLTALPTTINLGASTTLTWSSTDATTCDASNDWGGGDWTGARATSSPPLGESNTPAADGLKTFTLTCTGPGGNASSSAAVTVNPVGNIQVTSRNYVVTSTLVSSSWYFPSANSIDPCANQADCFGTSHLYSGMPLEIFTIKSLYPGQLKPPGFALRGIRQVGTVAEQQEPPSFFASLLNKIIERAKAVWVSNGSPCIPGPAPNCTGILSQTVTANTTTNFIIEWEPKATLSVSSAGPIALTDVAPTQTITGSNTGTAGSLMDWASSVNFGGGPAWLTITPGGAGLPAAPLPGSLQDVSLGVNLAAIPPGFCLSTAPCLASVTFNATSTTVSDTAALVDRQAGSRTIAVSFTITAPPLSCSPASETVNTGQNITLTAAGGNGTFNWSTAPPPGGSPPTFGPTAITTFTTNFSTVGPKTVTVVSGAQTDSCAVNVINVYCDYFRANPKKLIFPASTELSWQCHNATNGCGITSSLGENLGPVPPSPTPPGGTLSATPPQPGTITYTLTCNGAGVAKYTTQVEVETAVPTRREIGP